MTEGIPWPFAGRVAGLVAGDDPLASGPLLDHLRDDLPGVVMRAGSLVETETGFSLPGDPDVAVVSRAEWAERNVAAFQAMLAPAERQLAGRLSSVVDEEVGSTIAKRLVAAETGAMLGFLSRRVLGQYELVLPTESDADSIAFVGANLLSMERRHQFIPAEFRMWVALHEAAHRAQFVGVEWIRPHFLSLVEAMVAEAEPDEARLRMLVRRVRRARREGSPLIDERGLFGLFASRQQRDLLDRIQATMCVLEGHGHVVMDRVGDRVLRTRTRMAAVVKTRRADPRLAMFFRLTGLEMKLRQYEMGERFVLGVERAAGWRALDVVWSEAAALPTMAEIEDPQAWLRRVA